MFNPIIKKPHVIKKEIYENFTAILLDNLVTIMSIHVESQFISEACNGKETIITFCFTVSFIVISKAAASLWNVPKTVHPMLLIDQIQYPK